MNAIKDEDLNVVYGGTCSQEEYQMLIAKKKKGEDLTKQEQSMVTEYEKEMAIKK